MRIHLTILLILTLAIAHSAIGILGMSTANSQTMGHSIEANSLNNSNFSVVPNVKDCCQKSDAISHLGNMHCSADCNLYYVEVAVYIQEYQIDSREIPRSLVPTNHTSNLLRPPIA